jgi:hypothetical protein
MQPPKLVVHGNGTAFYILTYKDGRVRLFCIMAGEHYDYGYYGSLEAARAAAFKYIQE